MSSRGTRQAGFSARIEHLEDRRVMSADPIGGLLGGVVELEVLEDPVAAVPLISPPLISPPPLDQHLAGTPDFWITPEDAASLDNYLGQVEQFLTEAHQQSGWFNVRANYGFTGRGQTVAVIDSGVAYDHFALGGGFGANYRVVGGWDFAENDANPYDDGAAGGHGTHVSGIVGSSSTTNTGVAPGVDLVSLRVFDDAGAGFFSWVENALRWVHENRNKFENPITTVNMSLGVSSWNSATIPQWANLEDELAQLAADGIFIAVSAGNSFGAYRTAGLSYPASSQYVVPVMSSDDNGLLSSFSQRLGRAIAAPGRSIVSTIPDYKGNKNGVADDFATMSGTSMASPYLAGASVLVREAMEFVGMANVTQSTIYNHMMTTADVVFDASTNIAFKRLNLQKAIDALMPADDFGSSLAAAYDLGTLSGGSSIDGAIAKLNDVDFFKFTASATGSITFDAGATSGMNASWQVYAANGQAMGGPASGKLSFDVVGGQTYVVRLSSTGGLGHYHAKITATAPFTFEDWGAVSFGQMKDVAVSGEHWYRIEASQAGLLTVQGKFDATRGDVNVQLYNADRQLVASGVTTAGQCQVDVTANAGAKYFVRVRGANSDVDFTLVNLVSQTGSSVSVHGTSGDDAFTFSAGAIHELSINGVSYQFAADAAPEFHFNGRGGNDSIVLTGSAGDDVATLRSGSATLVGAGYKADVADVDLIRALGGGGQDQAFLYDSAGSDRYETWFDRAEMLGISVKSWSQAVGFARYEAFASTGIDYAIIHDSAGDDQCQIWTDRAEMTGAGYASYYDAFDAVIALAGEGHDQVTIYDSVGDDLFSATPERAVMWGEGYFSLTVGFDDATGVASSGFDRAAFHDSAGNDEYHSWSDRAQLVGSGFGLYARGFDGYSATAASGSDTAVLEDTTGDDLYESSPSLARMSSAGYVSEARGFDFSYGMASTGHDRAVMQDSAGDDYYRAWSDRVQMKGAGYLAYALNFDEAVAYATSGDDRAIVYDSLGNDQLFVKDWGVRVASSEVQNEVRGFDYAAAVCNAGGTDAKTEVDAVDYLFDLIGDWK